ncbi:hypothetical protein HMPREF0239_00227 [Clostridium sp. ATCC BAA-442]|nr:hypothetical protein HMPREF0239_00227 [Clostridium sp. ATCC BAA-442]
MTAPAPLQWSAPYALHWSGHPSESLVLSEFQPAPIDTRPPAPYAHTERKPYATYPCTAYKPPALIRLSRRLSAGSFSYLHEKANRTHTLKSRRGYVPAPGACRLPGHFQGNLMPPVRAQGRKTLPGVYAVPLQEQTGMRISICRVGELQLRNSFFIPAHGPLLSPSKQGKNHIEFLPCFRLQLFDTHKNPLSLGITGFLCYLRSHFLPKS